MKRTLPQNAKLHALLREVAQEMYMQNLDMKEVIKVPIRPTEENVKETMFKPVMSALYPEVKSTTELSTIQLQECWSVFEEAIKSKLGIFVGWDDENISG